MPSTPFTVKAIFEYSSDHDDDLTFPIGQIVTVTAVEDEEWLYGEYTDDTGAKLEGIFPKNFVEKYEPPAPPRPTRPSRPKKEKEPEVVTPSESPAVETPAVLEKSKPHNKGPETLGEAPTADYHEITPSQTTASTSIPVPLDTSSPDTPGSGSGAPVSASPPVASNEPAQKPTSKPPTSEKPVSSSFRDRIAAFNKPAAPPIAPAKPPGWSAQNTTFIKKPFVAPPPSKDSFVPPPREQPPKIYRREEDPEVREQTAHEPPVSESQPNLNEAAAQGDEEQPKPTSLKERIALLQKQQIEQAARRSEAAQKKEKPKKPKKPTEYQEHAQTESLEPESRESSEVTPDIAADATKGVTSPPLPSQEVVSDANDADYSAAADTEDADTSSTSKEDYDDGSRDESRKEQAQAVKRKEEKEEKGPTDEEGEEEEAEAEEEEEIDPEVRRRMELRERMAKMSGGIGMMGLFGPPGGMPLAGAGARKPKVPAEPEKEKSGDTEKIQPAAAPPVPMALPGMDSRKSTDQIASQESVEKETDEPRVPPITEQHPAEEVSDIEETVHDESPRRGSGDRPPVPPPHGSSVSSIPPPLPVGTRPIAPPAPGEQPLPTPPLASTRPVIPPIKPLDTGEDSDDELSGNARKLSLGTTTSSQGAVPSAARPSLDRLDSQQSSSVYDTSSPRSPPLASEMKASRQPPPIPSSPPLQSRPPPPLPTGDLRRRSTAGSRTSAASPPRQAGETEGEITEYDGDYDTDIASGAKHKDALKAHARESSLDEDTTTDDHSIQSPRGPAPESRPPPPPPHAPRTVPPPPPSQPPKGGRVSMDMPRGPPPSHPPKGGRTSVDIPRGPPSNQQAKSGRASVDMPRGTPSQPPKAGRASVDMPRGPPPPPPPMELSYAEDDEYDPFRYNTSHPGLPPPPVPSGSTRPAVSVQQEPWKTEYDDDLYGASPVQTHSEQSPTSSQTKRFSAMPPPVPGPSPFGQPPPVPQEKKRTSTAPHPPQSQPSVGRPSSATRNARASLDVPRGQPSMRRSMDVPRPSVDQGHIATDVDLAETTLWWTQPSTPPPVFQNRKDILLEIEQSPQRGGKTAVTKDVYVLFLDYSQTVITVHFDAKNPTDASSEQRHELPPHQPRQDQLEKAHTDLGAHIFDAVNKIQHTTVADGTPFGLIQHLLNPLPRALPPVGTRAFGALVYANLANASVQQNDEIRAGDIVSFRNARFQGHRGTMHQKYSAEVGKPDHVGIVVDWDGTKKKIRAWEQGRESKKVKMESFKLNDMRSGECKVWRVMPRTWVGWESVNQ